MNRIPPYQHIEKKLGISEQDILMAGNKFGTPLFLYDTKTLRENYLELRSNLSKKITIYYSAKANPNKCITQFFFNIGANIETASFGELMMVNELGIPGDRVILVGPGKSTELLELAVNLEVSQIVIESSSELNRLAQIVKKKGKQVSVALRVNPNFKSGSMISMSGNTQFGMNTEEAVALLNTEENYEYIRFSGIHVYAGTEILDEEVFLKNTIDIFHLSEQMQEETNRCFTFLDIGGGIGIPYYDKEKKFSFEGIKDRLNQEIDNYCRRFPDAQIAFESGRYLAGSAGVFLTKVLDKKQVKGKNYIILDGGTNNMLYPSQYGVKVPPLSIVGNNNSHLEKVTLCGPLCTPTDRMAFDVEIPVCKEGNFIAFYQAGAYGTTIAPGMFLSHGFPMEVMYHEGNLNVIRKRFGWKEILKLQEVEVK